MIKRLEKFIDFKGLSVRAFEMKIGTSDGMLRKAINTNKDIQSKWLSLMSENYPDLNLQWLITGQGEMLLSAQSKEEAIPLINYNKQGNPYYNVDFTGGFDLVFNSQDIHPDYFINFEPFNIHNGIWCNLSGKSMEPEINNGDKIIIREVKDWQTFLPLGEIYGIVTDEFRTVKRVGKSQTAGCLRLIPANPAYDTQDLPISKIIAIYQVIGAVKMF